MKTYIIYESELGYTSYYYETTTNAPLEDIQKLNVLEHRGTWVRIKDIADTLIKKGYTFKFTLIEPVKNYWEYRKEDNFIELQCGNY